jgi:hypothetical protein
VYSRFPSCAAVRLEAAGPAPSHPERNRRHGRLAARGQRAVRRGRPGTAAVTPRSVRSAAGGPSTPGGDAAAAVWGRKESTCRRRFPAPIGGCSARWAALTAVPAAAVPAPKTPNAPNRTGDAASCLGGLAGLGAGRPTVYEAETAAAAAPVAALAAAFRLRSAEKAYAALATREPTRSRRRSARRREWRRRRFGQARGSPCRASSRHVPVCNRVQVAREHRAHPSRGGGGERTASAGGPGGVGWL